LGTDYLDLYQCHRYDPGTPVDETARAMEDLIRQGKVLYWGVSVWTAEQITAACAAADRWGGYRPVSSQPPYSLLERGIEAEVLPTCARLGLSQIVWSPLAQGLLTGKYASGRIPKDSRGADEQRNRFLKPMLTPQNIAFAAHVSGVAADLGVTPAQLSLAWVLRRPEISAAIIGVTRVEQLRENLAAAELDLSAETIARVEEGLPAVG
jgi:aryl-alcohol dehydrogenase-like predicted oxidoreductase